MFCHYNRLCATTQQAFYEHSDAAKKKTMSDVSGKPNVAGLYSSTQSDGKT